MPNVFEAEDGATFKQVSCGEDHVAAVTSSGRLMTFGNPDHGKLGHAIKEKEQALNSDDSRCWNVKSKSSILVEKSKLAYVDIVDDRKCMLVKLVSCGFGHTACVTEDGSLWTLG